MANLRALVSRLWPFLDRRQEMKISRILVDRLSIQTHDFEQVVSTLSGGNQQEVILGRWLQRSPHRGGQ